MAVLVIEFDDDKQPARDFAMAAAVRAAEVTDGARVLGVYAAVDEPAAAVLAVFEQVR